MTQRSGGGVSAIASLKETLVRQYGASTREVVEAEVEGRLAGRTKLQREDLDAIERTVLAAVRQRRGTTRIIPRQRSSPGLVSAAPAKPALAPASPAASRTAPAPAPAHAQQRAAPPAASAQRAVPGTPAPSLGGRAPSVHSSSSRAAAAMALSGSAPALARSASETSVGPKRRPAPYGLAITTGDDTGSERSRVVVRPRYHVPLRPKLKPMDHWDMIVAYDAQKYLEETEEYELAGRYDEIAKVRNILDGQMVEIRALREQEAENKRKEVEEMKAQVEENRRIKEAEEEAEERKKAITKKANDDMMEALRIRKEKAAAKRMREQNAVVQWMADEKARQEQERRDQAEEYHRKCTKAREERDQAHAEAERRAAERKEEEMRMCKLAEKMMDDAEAGNQKAVADRMARIDELTRTFGAAIAERDAKEEAALQARIKRVQEESDRKAKEDAERRRTEHEKKVQDMLATRARQIQERAKEDLVEQAAGKKQAQIWKEQLEAGLRKDADEAEQRRKAREDQDKYLIDQIRKDVVVHPLQFGITEDIQGQEVGYNRAIFEQMAEESFHKDKLDTLIRTADAKATRGGGKLIPFPSVGPSDEPIHALEIHERDVC
eukprot:TRINITY_DN54606_c0_g1_i1.p2 TRINITY_DN54606_c0_g1~~TRINITY_DN54606_c0_g1_i1.p2  ORF type:complete len:609 (+),score=202.76 TRINITY_DN54606_c0_g1_i1:182-2008(+)